MSQVTSFLYGSEFKFGLIQISLIIFSPPVIDFEPMFAVGNNTLQS